MSVEAPRPRSPREAFIRRRTRVALASGTVVVAMGALGALLASPGDLGAVRWAGVGVAWWGTSAVLAVQLVALLVIGRPDRSAEDR